MSYGDLLRRHGGTVAFGFGLAFLSAIGQTFFISLFGPDIRSAFGLTHGSFGALYSAATLASGLLMIWVGGILDRVSTGTYALVALLGLSLAALGLSLAPNILALGLALFCLRLFAQGMLSHAAVTSTARLPQAIRGRAVSLALMGFSASEIAMPLVGVALVGWLGWVGAWRVAGAIPLAAALLVALGVTARRHGAEQGGSTAPVPAPSPFSRWSLLRDWRFLIFIPCMVGPPAINTGYFFHQRLIADLQGWPLELLALSVSAYAVTGVVATIATGWLVDRFGSTVLCRGHLLPLGTGSLVLLGNSGPYDAFLMFGLFGMTAAANGVVVPAVLAEIFGTTHLGTIRGLAAALMVVGSAATPVVFGLLFDWQVPLAALAIGCALYVVGASFLTVPLRRSKSSERLPAAAV
jgi:MFS family permease